MLYPEIENELGFDPGNIEEWPEGMHRAYVATPSNYLSINFAAGVAWERRRRRREAEDAVAALIRHDSGTPRETHPAIGVMG